MRLAIALYALFVVIVLGSIWRYNQPQPLVTDEVNSAAGGDRQETAISPAKEAISRPGCRVLSNPCQHMNCNRRHMT